MKEMKCYFLNDTSLTEIYPLVNLFPSVSSLLLLSHPIPPSPFLCPSLSQLDSLSLRVEQESQRRSLSQRDLREQTQAVQTLRSSEKKLQLEVSTLTDFKVSLEKTNQELRRCVHVCVHVCVVK